MIVVKGKGKAGGKAGARGMAKGGVVHGGVASEDLRKVEEEEVRKGRRISSGGVFRRFRNKGNGTGAEEYSSSLL